MWISDSLVIIALLLLNGCFALSELAVVSASKPLLRQKARQGDKRAERALRLAENPGRFLSTVQVGITLIGILAGAYGGATIAEELSAPLNTMEFVNPHGEAVAVAIVVTVITFFSVVMGELVPKRLALANPERLAMVVAGPMSVISLIFTPVVKILDGSANGLLRLLGYKKEDDSRVTEAEVKAVIAEGAESGAIEAAEYDMLKRIIRLGDRDVQSIMTHRTDVTFIDINDSAQDIRAKIKESGHSRYPVIENDINNVLGVISAKDLVGWNGEGGASLRALVTTVPALAWHLNCLKALELFKTSNAHMAIIIDEFGTTEGIVTASDLLEAIVGALPSNYGADETQIWRREDGSWLVDGVTPVDEIYITLGLEPFADEDADYQTIAGFVIHDLGRAPRQGDRLEKFGYSFEVVDMDGRRIDKLLIKKMQRNADAAAP
jgi:putative hemolysin